jgi:hypothetical protein
MKRYAPCALLLEKFPNALLVPLVEMFCFSFRFVVVCGIETGGGDWENVEGLDGSLARREKTS